MTTTLSLKGGASLAGALALVLLMSWGCSESTGPMDDAAGAVDLYVPPPAQSVYSLQSGVLAGAVTSALEHAVSGNRWCAYERLWLDPASESCTGGRQEPPFGQVIQEEEDLIISAGLSRAAPFIWTGPPNRANPFPADGDFTVDFRMKVDQFDYHRTGINLLRWDPASTEGANDPATNSVLSISADTWNWLLLRITGVKRPIRLGSALVEHEYHLAYEAGAYTLYIDGQKIAGPIESNLRPTAVWMGSPTFSGFAAGWTDFRLSQFNVSTPAEEVAAVSVHVKPGGCPSPMNLKGRGVLPVAIAGTSELDIAQIDGATLRLAGVPARRFAVEDVATPVEPLFGRTTEDCSSDGPDGIVDLTAKFSVEELAAALADAEEGEWTLTLTGNLLPEFGGTPITGEDVVIIRR